MAVPAVAASLPVNATDVDYGLYVSTQFSGGNIGYNGSNSTGVTAPTTPQGYFATSPKPESDLNWSDATNSPVNSSLYVNSEGSFTPATNAAGSSGSYSSTSGFWFSVPTTAPGTGTGYVPASNVTLATGATFVTQVRVTIPAGANVLWPLQNARIGSAMWNKPLTGTLIRNGTTGTYNYNMQAAGSWSAPTPTTTQNADGSATLTGTITFTTTAPVSFSQTGTKYYGQVIIMPATVSSSPAYGWTNFSLTSYVQSATLAYTVPAPYTRPLTTSITGLNTTSAIHP